MNIKALFLPLILTISCAFAAPTIQFRYERDLLDMYCHPTHHSTTEKQAMAQCVNRWVLDLINEYVDGNIDLSPEDQEYIMRIATMNCDVLNWREY